MLKKSMLIAMSFAHVSVLAFASQIQAKPSQEIAQRVDCKNANTTVEINYCAAESYRAADRRLNDVYRQLSSTVRGEEKNKLIDAQVTWIQYRDRNCSFETFANKGGTGYSTFLLSCLERMTRQRTADFEQFMNSR
ncbi:MAG: lysozyme inhibitor LprI family protein [Coleofasciculaceae cyanobacterium]